jgi:hypothetical protein
MNSNLKIRLSPDQSGSMLSASDKEAGLPQIGVAEGEFTLTDSFFEPLPEEILKAFSGE